MTSQRHRVLVIDDERGPRESLRILLKNDYDVVCAESVDDGARLLKEGSADVVVMDIRMPGKTGIQGLAELRRIDPIVSIIMLTGFGTLETAQEAIRLGANDYIKKPFDAADMQAAIRTHVQKTQVQRMREHAMADLQDLTRRLNEELAAREHLAQLGMASSELVHDMGNPLTAVLGYAELLADTMQQRTRTGVTDDAEAIQYLEEIARNVKRCKEMTDAWRSMSRGGTRNSERVCPAEVVEEVFRTLRPSAPGIQMEAQWIGTSGREMVTADRLQLFRALQNVIQNAVHAIQEINIKGAIRVEGRDQGGAIEIRITDNGPGIPATALGRIFEPFYTTKTSGRGTGLGLCITQKVIKDLGGKIRVESEVGRGTTFILGLPIAP